MDGETLVARLPDGTELLVMHWPSAALSPKERWHAAVRDPSAPISVWSAPLEIIRVEERT